MNRALRKVSAIFIVSVLLTACSTDAGVPQPTQKAVAVEEPTAAPTPVPSPLPSVPPTEPPTALPIEVPTETPTEAPTEAPTEVPTPLPTKVPTETPTEVPTPLPTEPTPTQLPTPLPTEPPPTPTATATPEDTGSADKKTVLPQGQVTKNKIDEFTLCAMGRSRDCTMEPAIERGLFETGLRPRFPDNTECRGIDEKWAISYTAKRLREAYHGGIDMPAPPGTLIIAAAAGTVIGKYLGENTPRGIEIVLRHSPQETGLPVWTYTQYTHFSKMPKHEVGQRVRMGEVLGPTGNTGINVRTGKQSETRRPAIHFGVFFNTSGKYAALRNKIIPAQGLWMDPNAMFRKKPPFDSKSLKALPRREKQIPISIMFEDGTTYPANTKIVWPYTC